MARLKRSCYKWELVVREPGTSRYYKLYGQQIDGLKMVQFREAPTKEVTIAYEVPYLERILKWGKDERQKYGLSAKRI
jgi:hypothetical protein